MLSCSPPLPWRDALHFLLCRWWPMMPVWQRARQRCSARHAGLHEMGKHLTIMRTPCSMPGPLAAPLAMMADASAGAVPHSSPANCASLPDKQGEDIQGSEFAGHAGMPGTAYVQREGPRASSWQHLMASAIASIDHARSKSQVKT